MPDVTIARLREVAGPKLYAGNAFRLTGLPTVASRQDVLHRKQQLATMRQLGLDEDAGADEAFDRILGDPRRRLVEELFWLWDTPDARCGCPRGVHRDHDDAVRAHSTALEQTAPLSLWKQAGQAWQWALRGDGFWQHVRQRIVALDDRQLDESVVAELREELPAALVKPLVQLAASAQEPRWLAEFARAWPAPASVIDDQLEAAAAALYDAVEDLTKRAADLVESGQLQGAADLLNLQVVPIVERLTQLVPPGRHRRTANVRNDVAIVFNNGASALLDRGAAAFGRLGPGWLGWAAELATDPRTVRAVSENRAAVDSIVQTLETIERRVREFVSYGRPDLARAMLRDIKRKLGDAPGAGAIDRMLAEVGDQPVTAAARQGSGCLTFAVIAICMLAFFFLVARCTG